MGAACKSGALCSFLPLACCASLQSNLLINGWAQIHCLAAEISVGPNPGACGLLPTENTRIDEVYTPGRSIFDHHRHWNQKQKVGKKPTVPWKDFTLAAAAVWLKQVTMGNTQSWVQLWINCTKCNAQSCPPQYVSHVSWVMRLNGV